jgi:hypothetical protein
MFVDPSFGVYADSDSARFHFDQFDHIKFKYELYERRLDEFLTKSYTVRIATFHVPFPVEQEWLDRLKFLYKRVNHVFVFCTELHERTVEQLQSIDWPHVSIYICGKFTRPFRYAKVYQMMDWFHSSTEFYARTKPGFLDQRLTPFDTKPKTFDILLGNQRPHRDFVYAYVNNNGLANSVLMTYVYFSHNSILNSERFILESDGVEYYPERRYVHSIDTVKYFGRDMTLSQIVPIQIYNQTAYSVVAETNFSSEFNFYTEKIVKPIIAQRLFIVIAGRSYLKNLRNMGFKTFDGIIDESYDDIPYEQDRWSRAMEQVKWLSTQDQESILKEIYPIVSHNHDVMMDTNWYKKAMTFLESEVKLLIDNSKVSPTSIAKADPT